MVKTVEGLRAQVGDLIEITEHSVGDRAPDRSSRCSANLGTSTSECAGRTGTKSINFPAEDAVIRHPKTRRWPKS
jgi:hypothetical protein